MFNETLQEVVDNYKTQIAEGDYKSIMKTIPKKSLASFLEALKEAEVAPFVNIPEYYDLELFANTLVDVRHRWDTGFFVKGLDPNQQMYDTEALEIAKACAALGFKAYKTAQGYWGNEDYLITLPSRSIFDILADENLEDYNPSDFTEIKFTDLQLYS